MKKLLVFLLLIIPLWVQAQTILTVNGETHNYDATQLLGYDVPRSTVTTFTFTNNLLTSLSTGGYILQAGDDSPNQSATFNHLDGEVIMGNKLIYNGADQGQYDLHGIFTGHNINAVIKYNYTQNVPMSIIRKSTQTMTNTSGGVAYNIINNPEAVGIVVKGMNAVNIYNNTIYSTEPMYTSPSVPGVWRGLIDVYTNTDVTPNVPAINTKIKNNIFYTTHQIANIYIYDAACLTGFESDYNVFWCTAGTPYFNYLGTIKTFAQWQALGFDTHSVVVNPNFINFTSFVPTARLDYGTNLGTTWSTGLSTSATWTVGVAPATTDQNGTWQVGAVIRSGSGGGGGSTHAHYVSTTGNNANAGTFASPWLTWQYGFNNIPAGDTLFIRGGTYLATSTSSNNMYCGVAVDSKNGTSGAKYHVLNYPNEIPVLDCRNISGTGRERAGVLLINSSYWHLKGLNFTRCDQPSSGGTGGQGLLIYSGNYNLIEACNAYINGGPGMGMRGSCEQNTFLNCDSYNNWDAYSGTPGDNADGFDIGFITYRAGNLRINYFTGCRAWGNGDDGFDMYQMSGYRGIYYLTNCWAWKQGYYPDGVTQGGNGCGFKYGNDDAYPLDAAITRFTYNCIAYANRTRGFSQETANAKMVIFNSIGYNNGNQNFSFVAYNTPDQLTNNISYPVGDVFQSQQVMSHNSWNGHTVTNADFASISPASLSNPRQSNGNLPVIPFLHLAQGSGLIGAGVSTGIALDGDGVDWNGTYDIGPFKYGTGGGPPSPVLTTDLTINSAGSATTITVNGGTLQFSVVAVVPTNATDQTVNWSVVNGTGTATINSTGLLTATGDGTVTVWGYAHDNSGAYDYKVITISNQIYTPLVTKVWVKKGVIWHLGGKVITQRR